MSQTQKTIKPKNCFLQIAVPIPLRKLFDYLAPVKTPLPKPGQRVLISFGRKKLVGIVIKHSNKSEIPKNKLKNILEILDPEPIFNQQTLHLLIWASNYYQHPIGEVLHSALPKALRNNKVLPITKNAPATSYENIVNNNIPKLNQQQQCAINAINKSFNNFNTFLLAGITGSGKTEVYLQVVHNTVLQNKQAIIIVPEISLTPQLITRITERFNVTLAVLHSKLSDKARLTNWQMAYNGSAQIIIGTRSAALIPYKNPGIFIIDEEHDSSFKQQSRLRYSARDLIIMRASMEQIPVVLGSATPSLETIYNAHNNKYHLLTLPNRAGNARPPKISIVDTRQQNLPGGLSNKLLNKIRVHLEANNQILLFLNRRGYAPVLMCFACGTTIECPKCDTNLTIHLKSNKLQCHHCGISKKIPEKCSKCDNTNLAHVGTGTEKIEQVLQEYFPNAVIDRIDKDTTTKKSAMTEAVDKVKSGVTNILLGTQMIAKGHDFPNVTLAAIIDMDSAWFSADFRSIEKMAQLIIQVAGRAGRAAKLGEVVLQTKQPKHPLLKLLLETDYLQFSKNLLQNREQLQLPPYSYQALIFAKAKTRGKAMNILSALKMHLKQYQSSCSILGPVPAIIEKRANYYYAQLLLQDNTRKNLHTITATAISFMEQQKIPVSDWAVDFDPIEV